MPSVYPITLFEPGELQDYPHMAKRDAPLWVRFLRARAKDFIAFSYDVALGGVNVELPDQTEKDRLAWKYSTALKIDAVGWQGNQVWLFEVRPSATVSAFGSALCYTMVARREQLTNLPLIPAIICEEIQPDVRWCCDQSGVQVVVV